MTRLGRGTDASRIYRLTPTSRLPAQSVLLSVESNKEQLSKAIVQDLKDHKDDYVRNSLVVTGQDPTPIEISGPSDDEDSGKVVPRHDLRDTYDEAGNIILHRVS